MEQRNGHSLTIQTLNVQGLSQMKKYEIEKVIEKQEKSSTVITGLTETHITEDKYNFDNFKVYEQRRTRQDKRGGGLLILHKDEKGINLEKVESKHQDVLAVRGIIHKIKLIIILVYLAIGNAQACRERNNQINDSIHDLVDQNKDDYGVVLMGDFNGHLGLLGTQQEDENGRRVKKIAKDHNLSIMNLDDKCDGQTTWIRADQRSCIGFILIDAKMMEIYEEMRIDENQSKWELSDHTILEIAFKVKTNVKWSNESNEVVYLKINQETIEAFINELEDLLEHEVSDIDTLNGIIRTEADKTMKRKYVRKKKTREMSNLLG